MNPLLVINSIVERLRQSAPLGQGIVAGEFPQTENEYVQQGLLHPTIRVLYVGSTFSESKTMGGIGQDETMSVLVIVQSKTLYDQHNGCLAMIANVLRFLVGFTPVGCRKMTLKNTMLESNNLQLGWWEYQISFEVPTTIVEDHEEEVTVNISQITAEVSLIDANGGPNVDKIIVVPNEINAE